VLSNSIDPSSVSTSRSDHTEGYPCSVGVDLQGISIALSIVIGLLYKVLSVGVDWTTWQSACATCDRLRPGAQLCGLTPALSARVGPGLHLHTT